MYNSKSFIAFTMVVVSFGIGFSYWQASNNSVMMLQLIKQPGITRPCAYNKPPPVNSHFKPVVNTDQNQQQA